METFTNLLQATEGLLAKAEENLRTLKAMQAGAEEAAAKLAPLLERCVAVGKAIIEHKEKMLEALLRLTLLAKMPSYCFSSGCGDSTTLEICSLTEVRFLERRGTTVIREAKCALTDFVTGGRVGYFWVLCRRILEKLRGFLEEVPKEQARETGLMIEKIEELVALSRKAKEINP